MVLGGVTLNQIMNFIYQVIDAGCVESYLKNIDYKYNEKDSRINGRGAAISGFEKGYLDANEIIKKNIKVFGKDKVHSYLEEIWEGA